VKLILRSEGSSRSAKSLEVVGFRCRTEKQISMLWSATWSDAFNRADPIVRGPVVGRPKTYAGSEHGS
jgi:hypothetical protein